MKFINRVVQFKYEIIIYLVNVIMNYHKDNKNIYYLVFALNILSFLMSNLFQFARNKENIISKA